MNVHLAVGGEVDLASGAELEAAVKDLKSDIALCRPQRDPRPVRRKFILGHQAAGPAGYDNTSTPKLLTADGAILSPSVGRVWEVRACSVFNAVQPSSGIGTAHGFTVNGGDPNQASVIDVKPGSNVNGTEGTTYTRSSIVINPNEELYVVVLLPQANVGYIALVEVDEYPDTCYEAQSI